MTKSIIINSTSFGQITINHQVYDYDVVIRSTGEIVPRKKQLSSSVSGTSHKVAKAEVADLLQNDQFRVIIIGNGQSGVLELLPESQQYLESQGIEVIIKPTPEAIKVFNKRMDEKEPVCGFFHLTC